MTTSTERRVPRADCIADSAGGITFDIAGTSAPDAALVLKRSGGPGGVQDETRLPLTPTGEGSSRAVLPSTVELAEGRWEAYVGDEAVEPGIRDLRTLLDRTPDADRITVRVPYPTADGRLAVRCWVRAPHAEAGEIGLAPERGAMTVEGRLYGAELGEGAVAEARLRGSDKSHRAPVTGGDGGAFGFTLPYGPLAEQHLGKQELWDMWLRPTADAAWIRIARILDDIHDRKNIFVYPKLPSGDWLAAPCYTSDNELCVRLTAAP
ncbi:hypothetical protein J7E87_08530 [Streptomyces sp. ISL-1]|uniref:hypothetical protein n=1 Tax=Streptomyces sp. ISL-1 TaxID=2817657 RepID=UPI001BE544B3|nr:hypothetical protein [Streptomyces sp. ISL-1]MBT2389474.1 hypothetical protein [Streptomyces sp. ISL-1]